MFRHVRSVILEATVLLLIGVGVALLANSFSPRGLSLRRDYFAYAKAPASSNQMNTPASSSTAADELQLRLQEKGLSLIEGEEVEKLFRDPRYEQESVVFVDARNDKHYQEGHIPGAYQFDRYYPERYLPAVLPACLGASRVIVYCTGGKCEDSEFAALTLIEAGVPAANISVYGGGINHWVSQQWPVELGERRSGNLRP